MQIRFAAESYAVRTKENNLFHFCLFWRNIKTASSISRNCPFLGPLNLFRDASHLLIAALRFCHIQILPSSTPKNCSGFAVALLLCAPNSFMFKLSWVRQSFRLLASFFQNYGKQQTGTHTSHILTTKAQASFWWDCARLFRKACFTVPVGLIHSYNIHLQRLHGSWYLPVRPKTHKNVIQFWIVTRKCMYLSTVCTSVHSQLIYIYRKSCTSIKGIDYLSSSTMPWRHMGRPLIRGTKFYF